MDSIIFFSLEIWQKQADGARKIANSTERNRKRKFITC
jgi:hypothetical protein